MASRNMFLAALCFVLVSKCQSEITQNRVLSKPHILFLLVDDLGWSDVGFHDISKIRTPNINKLANESVILDNYYTQPLCTPTRASIMTGRYPIHTGLQVLGVRPNKAYGLPLTFRTLPRELREVGYATHAVGKWHLGMFQSAYLPTNRGFDSFFGLYNGAGNHFKHTKAGILDLHDGVLPVRNEDGAFSTYIFTKKVEDIVEAHDPKKPLFIYMAFQSNHSPLQAPADYIKKYSFIKDKRRRTYAAMMNLVDEGIGNITEAFKRAGLWDDTLTIFASDNGGRPSAGGYNWPLRGHKNTLWEGGVRAPAFVHGRILGRKGVKCKELMHVTDWYPTLINLAGATYNNTPIPVDGYDMWATLSNGTSSKRKEILHNINPYNASPEGKGMAIRVGDMKLLVDVKNYSWEKPPELGTYAKPKKNKAKKGGLTVLYNITADPEERHDLSDRFPETVKELQKKLATYLETMVPSLYMTTMSDPRAKQTAKKNGYWGPWYPGE